MKKQIGWTCLFFLFFAFPSQSQNFHMELESSKFQSALSQNLYDVPAKIKEFQSALNDLEKVKKYSVKEVQALEKKARTSGFALIDFVVTFGAESVIHHLIEEKRMNIRRGNPLNMIIERGLHSIVKLFFRKGLNPNKFTSKTGETFLIQAVSSNRTHIVEELLSYPQAKIEAKDRKGRTALYLAVENNFVRSTELLLKAGANPYTVGKAFSLPGSFWDKVAPHWMFYTTVLQTLKKNRAYYFKRIEEHEKKDAWRKERSTDVVQIDREKVRRFNDIEEMLLEKMTHSEGSLLEKSLSFCKNIFKK